MGLQPDELHLIDAELWARTRSGARAGRGFRYQDAVSAWLAAAAWSGDAAWVTVVPEGVDDVTLHGEDLETRVQIKSRHDPRGLFSTAEIAGYVAKAALDLPDGWSDDPRCRIAVVLERPPADLVETGFHQSLASSGQALDAFTQALRVQLPDGFDLDALRGRISVVVEPEPLTRCADALAPSGLDPAARTLVAQMLRDIAGERADRNYRAAPPAIFSLGRTDVQERLDHAAGLIDPAGYLDLTAGLADVADFTAAMPAEGFYSGVNTAPGHVGAGLVFDRPEAVAEVLEALESRRAALVVGPSGAGKSALAWLAAYHSRHTVRWYRLRGLREGDVGRIATLAKRLEATTARPVGFVLDDAGRDATDGWDGLVKEVEQTPGLLALATVREEDLFLLATATRTRAIRPTLNEDLAARLWAALHAQGSVEFAHWREPFEKSEGLLLEYVHLLTAGRRLAETIQEQVRRRLAEGRGAELRVLRAVACASAHGGAVDPIRLRDRENLDEIAFAQAMQRLVDEHAVRVRPDGSIAGLHEIRSQHLDEAVRSLLGDTPEVAIAAALATLTAASLAAFIAGVLRRWPEAEAVVMDGLVERLGDADAATWIGAFHGLGLATADDVAARWLEISREAELNDRSTDTLFTLASMNSEFGDDPIFANFNRARAAFATLTVPDRRRALLDRIGDGVSPPELNWAEANALAAALLPLHGAPEPPTMTLVPPELGDPDLDSLIPLLETAWMRGVEPAQTLVDAAGGTEHLLDRLYVETAWATPPTLGEFEGQAAVFSNLKFVHPEVQPDIHAAAVAYCRKLAAVAPAAERIVCDAVWADGQPAGMGDHTMATLRLVRRAVTPDATVAWNRAQSRAISRLVATGTATGRVTFLASAIREVAGWVEQAGDFYCRQTRPDARWLALLQVRKLLTTFVSPPSVENVQGGPLAAGAMAGRDYLHGFVTGLERLMTELTDGISDKPSLIAARTVDLAREALKLQDPAVWRNTAEPPIEPLKALEATLWNIRAVLGDAVNDPSSRQTAALQFGTVSRRHSVLQRAADRARTRAEARIEQTRETIRAALEARGVTATVISRPAEKARGWQWPEVEYAALVPMETVIDVFPLEPVLAECGLALDLDGSLSLAPVVQGHVAPMGFVYIRSVLPLTTFLQDWKDHLPFPPLPESEARQRFERGIDAAFALSFMSRQRDGELNEEEEAFFSVMAERLAADLNTLVPFLGDNPHPMVGDAALFLCEAAQRVATEASDQTISPTLAEDYIGVVRGVITPFAEGLILARLGLIDHEATEAAAERPDDSDLPAGSD